MSVVSQFCKLIEKWDTGGSIEILELLKPHFLNIELPDSSSALRSAFHAIIASTLQGLSEPRLNVRQIVSFIQLVVDALPSSSDHPPPSLSYISECLVDTIWSVQALSEDLQAEDRKATKDVVAEGDDVLMKEVEDSFASDQRNLVDIVRQLLNLGVLSVAHCRERWEMSFLYAVGLIHDKNATDRKEVRTRTNLLYKQNKVNLLREQMEGYTKLTAELSGSIGPAHDPATGLPIESGTAIAARAESAWNKVLGLIGYFDLDPNRALDVVIDVFCAHITTHYAFFIALLRISPWCRAEEPYSPPDPGTASRGSASQALAAEREEIANHEERFHFTPETQGERTLPGSGDMPRQSFDQIIQAVEGRAMPVKERVPVCAQIVGFKFGHYRVHEANRSTPRSLYMVAALMIREGLMILEDIYEHLGPQDAEMNKIYEERVDEIKKEYAVGQANALSMAAPLPKDDIAQRPRQTPGEPPKPQSLTTERAVAGPRRSSAQKIGILAALLSLGALRPAISLISRFPWVVDTHAEISDLMLRILQASLEPFFRLHNSFDQTSILENCETRPKWSQAGPTPWDTPKPVLTLLAPTPPNTIASSFVFFYPTWEQHIPLCLTERDFVDIMEPFVSFLGMQIHRNLNFLSKLCQIAGKQITKKTPDMLALWQRMLRNHILPALSMTSAQSIIAVDVWNMLKSYDTDQRWQMYAEWGSSSYRKNFILELRRTEVVREVKGLLRRLSSDNMDQFTMAVTKFAHANPCILFSIAVNQVQSYENLGAEIVKSLGKVTILPFDVLTFVLVDAFSQPDKEHVKDDGISVSEWLTNLSIFSSSLFKTYIRLELPSVLRYILHRLRGGDHVDTIILQDLISEMCGIQPLLDLSESQIVALRGGEILRTEAVASDRRGVLSKFNLRSADRFNSTLKSTDLLLPLLVLLAQHRQSAIHLSRSDNLKAVSHLYDTGQALLSQYIQALITGATSVNQRYVLQLPPVSDLEAKYGIEPSICMFIYQPKLRTELAQFQEVCAKQEKEDALKQLLAKGVEPRPSPLLNHDYPLPEGSPWNPMLESLFPDIKQLLPKRAQDFLGVSFFATFWQLTAYDLAHPHERHDEEYLRLRGILQNPGDETAKSKAQYALNNFVSEAKTQLAHCAAVRQRLEKEKLHWFASDQGSSKKVPVLASQIVKHCLQPRALLSQSDADFSALLIPYLHQMGTPGFHTFMVYDKLLNNGITTTIFSCSEQEALNYGRFLKGILSNLFKLHQSEDSWNKNNMRGSVYLPGFQRNWTGKEKLNQSDLVPWHDFRSANKKWHKKLGGTLSQCLESTEYIHVHNAVVILKEIIDVFPLASVNNATGKHILETIEDRHKNETRQDLLVLIASYKARLQARKALWSTEEVAAKDQQLDSPSRHNPQTTTIDTSQSVGQSSAGRTKGDTVAESRQASTAPPSASKLGAEKVATYSHSSTKHGRNPLPDDPAKDGSQQPTSQSEESKLSSVPVQPPADHDMGAEDTSPVVNMVVNGSTEHSPKSLPLSGQDTKGQLVAPSAEELRLAAKQSVRPRHQDVDKVEEITQVESLPQPDSPHTDRKRSNSPPHASTRNNSADSKRSAPDGSRGPVPVDQAAPTANKLGEHANGGRSLSGRHQTRELDKERGELKERERPKTRNRERERERDRPKRDWDKSKEFDRDRSRREINERSGASSRREDSGAGRLTSAVDDELANKRRRLSDDEAERSSRRSAKHRDSARDDRPARPREDRDRDFDRRLHRKDREREPREIEIDRSTTSETLDKSSDRSSRTQNHPPLAPRAMAAGDTPSNRGRSDHTSSRELQSRPRREREHVLHSSQPVGVDRTRERGPANGSVRSRVSDIASRDGAPPLSPRSEERGSDLPKKRTYSERVRNDSEAPDPGNESSSQPVKRHKRIKDRNRFGVDDIKQHIDPNRSGSGRD